jgi:hypothetical protein
LAVRVDQATRVHHPHGAGYTFAQIAEVTGLSADDAEPLSSGRRGTQQPRSLLETLLHGGNGSEHIEALRDAERKALGHQAAERVVHVPLGLHGVARGERVLVWGSEQALR